MTVFSMKVKLQQGLLDLTDASVLGQLDTDIAELDGLWEQQVLNGDPVPTQILAVAAYASNRFQGLRFFSHEAPGKMNIMIWTGKLKHRQ
jgi:hypothetical protein